jgi:hypothetical protein
MELENALTKLAKPFSGIEGKLPADDSRHYIVSLKRRPSISISFA